MVVLVVFFYGYKFILTKTLNFDKTKMLLGNQLPEEEIVILDQLSNTPIRLIFMVLILVLTYHALKFTSLMIIFCICSYFLLFLRLLSFALWRVTEFEEGYFKGVTLLVSAIISIILTLYIYNYGYY